MASTSTSSSANPHLAFDAGLLLSTDSSPLDAKSYADEKKREELIRSRVLASTQALIAHLHSLPIVQHPDHGPLASLPAPSFPLLPREKPLPKAKPETKWEAFAKRKGIASNKAKDKLVWDDETKEWVPRWGYKGKNKKEEEQWIHELPTNADDDFNPVADLKKQRKERSLQNKSQQLKNIARANAQEQKASEKSRSTGLQSKALGPTNAGGRRQEDRERQMSKLDADVRRSRASTASMGRFDRKLDGEQKERGIKRKFDANEVDAAKERASNLALLTKMKQGTDTANKRSGDKSLVNARKAVRFASQGKGSAALVGRSAGKGKTGKK